MADNLKLWDAVRRPPEDALKGFKRAGGFTGTAIKPMWSIRTMTEQFGPVGQGWGINEPSFSVVNGDNKEIMVYCKVSVWQGDRSNFSFGVGGDKVVTYIKENTQYKTPERWNNDDEAFKKAFTDAVTNALKFLGVGADIHMGLWDGSKYAIDETLPKTEPKAASREPYEKINKGINEIEKMGTHEELKSWYKTHVKTIEAFPTDWHEQIMERFTEVGEALKAKMV